MSGYCSLEIAFNASKRLFKLSGIDALDKSKNTDVTTISIADLAQISYLLQQNVFQSMISDNKERNIVQVPHHINAVQNFTNFSQNLPPKIEEKAKREKIPKAIRSSLWALYNGNNTNGKCYACNTQISCFDWHASHVIADVKGGHADVNNLRVCCQHCNTSMGDQNLYAYIRDKNLPGLGYTNMTKYFQNNPSQIHDTRSDFNPPQTDINRISIKKVFDIETCTKDELSELTIFNLKEIYAKYGLNIPKFSTMKKSEMVDIIYEKITKKSLYDKINFNKDELSELTMLDLKCIYGVCDLNNQKFSTMTKSEIVDAIHEKMTVSTYEIKNEKTSKINFSKDELSELTVVNLKEIHTSHKLNIPKFSTMKKSEMVNAIYEKINENVYELPLNFETHLNFETCTKQELSKLTKINLKELIVIHKLQIIGINNMKKDELVNAIYQARENKIMDQKGLNEEILNTMPRLRILEFIMNNNIKIDNLSNMTRDELILAIRKFYKPKLRKSFTSFFNKLI